MEDPGSISHLGALGAGLCVSQICTWSPSVAYVPFAIETEFRLF